MVRTGTMFKEEQRSTAIGIPCEKVTRVRIFGSHLWSTVGIGARLREELMSRRSRIPGDEVGYEMAYGGWTACGRDLCNGLHEVCVQGSVFAKDIGRNWIGVDSVTVRCRRAASCLGCRLRLGGKPSRGPGSRERGP
uniref:Uncharacterized protein n=1 Tax=Oryza sativa subsp. japonica TaxID=39947 RepID=Q2QQ72_ORYSJ|nr:hypothetical protein LOC_Os12g32010 [Oryza sativa Japonica Group]